MGPRFIVSIRMTGETRDRICDPWFTRQMAYHSASEASKLHQILRHFDGASINDQGNSTIQQNRR